MDPDRIKDLLGEVQRGGRTVEEALRELKDLPFRNLEFARADTHRHLRTGFPEVVFGLGKTSEQIATILIELARGGSPVFATRVAPGEAAAIVESVQAAGLSDARHLPLPRAIAVGPPPPPNRGRGVIAIVSAGTADLPVAEEAVLAA